jgi:molybdopterin/thiamine biosynthesis adenylyltransferase
MDEFGWNDYYKQLIERNIGIISAEEQEKIRTTHVVLFGVGGLGGRIAEILVRSGCEHLSIIDFDTYSISNLSTHNITKNDIGKYKVDILNEKFVEINPNMKIRKYYSVDEKKISSILQEVDIATLSLDGAIGSILVARECRKKHIPLVEAWSLPYIFAWWFTENNIDYESCYRLNTREKSYSELVSMTNLQQHFRNQVFSVLEKFPNFHQYYNHEEDTIEKMRNGAINLRSLTPLVFMTSGYVAFELIFAGILKRKEMILAPEIRSYDIFESKYENFHIGI